MSRFLLLWLATLHAVRVGGPILTPASSPRLGPNIDGPSLIRVPTWLQHPMGRFYLYFASHQGKYIRLAYANDMRGPWKVYEPGTLRLSQVLQCHDHIASPDVHVDNIAHRIVMYFHCPAAGGVDIAVQKTLVAFSSDGLTFKNSPALLGPAYFRVFRWHDWYYAICWGGALYRSSDGVSPFEAGLQLIPIKDGRQLRHAAVYVEGDVLNVFYSRIGDRPERILLSQVKLRPDWKQWSASAPETILKPDRDYEGANLPLAVSQIGFAPGRVRQLRDPAIFADGGHLYLLYSIAGESGIALAELK